MHDLSFREIAALVPLCIFVFWIGLYPKPLLDVMHASVGRVLASQSTPVMVQKGEGGLGDPIVMTPEPYRRSLAMHGEVAP